MRLLAQLKDEARCKVIVSGSGRILFCVLKGYLPVFCIWMPLAVSLPNLTSPASLYCTMPFVFPVYRQRLSSGRHANS
jgi:hypothetical protein